MDSRESRQEAMEKVGKAYQAHMQGRIAEAIALYTESLELCPTPEAYTYRGWARSAGQDFTGAVEDCHRAIDLDPEFGNAYNDIGAYHLEMGEPEDAVPWLRMALKARRYENYCFPHYNLGRIEEGRGRFAAALAEYRLAQAEDPSYALAAKAIDRVQAKLATLNPTETP